MKNIIKISGIILLIFLIHSCNKEKPKLPTLTTTDISTVTQTTSISGGNITNDGGALVIARGVCWNTSNHPTIANSKTLDGTGTGSFTSSITGLTLNTKYYVCSYATNSAGTAYGNEQNFTTESVNDKYIIEMNEDFRISRITHIVGDNVLDYDKLYNYSDKYVKVYNGGILISTYFLNNFGLADSCIEGTYRIQYHYNNDNYLTSYNSNYLNINYSYVNGNRTTGTGIHYSAQYQYNTMINTIDIDEFQGSYLGKLNKNLLQFKSLMFTMVSDGYSIAYQYKLNSEGLVVKRTGTTTYNRSGSSPDKTITDFEYIIKN